MVKYIVYLIVNIALTGGAMAAQPLRGEEARRWQQALLAAQQSRPQEALELFKTVLGDKKDPGLFQQAGAHLVRGGGQDQAEALYLWGRQVLKKPEAFADKLAEIYQSQARYDMAVAEWTRLLPQQVELVRARLLEIGLNAGFDKAVAWSQSRLRSAGDPGRSILVDLYLGSRNYRKAREIFFELRDVAYLRRGWERLSASGLPPAQRMEILEYYLARCGWSDVEAMVELGDYFAEERRWNKALEVFDRLSRQDRWRAALGRARLHLKQGDQEKALEQLELAAGWGGADTNRWTARLLQAQARIAAGQEDLAANSLRAMALDSTVKADYRQMASFARAELFLMQGALDSALAAYRGTIGLGYEGDVSNDALLRILLISEQRGDRIEDLKKYGQGLRLKARGDFRGALDIFSQIARSSPRTWLGDQSLLEAAAIW